MYAQRIEVLPKVRKMPLWANFAIKSHPRAKMQLILILRVSNRIASISRCYNSPTLKLDFVLEVRYCEQLRVRLPHLRLGFPHPFGTL